jgi:hypothetical protein
VDNTDLLDAIVSCEIYHKHIAEKNKVIVMDQPTKRQIPVIEYINGRAVKTWKEVKL